MSGGRPHKNYDNHKSSPLQGPVGRTFVDGAAPQANDNHGKANHPPKV
jgi:hypothetical protein